MKFKNIARFINGRAFKPSEWKKKGLPIIRIQNLNDPKKPFNYFDDKCDDKYLVKNGEILISWSASLGVYVWDRGDAVLNQHIFKVLPNEKLVDRDYFFYCAQTKLDEMGLKVHGSTMKHITRDPFLNLEIPIPPLETQNKIAAILKRADQLKQKREQANQMTNKILQAVFLKMFGDKLPENRIGDIVEFVSSGATPLGGEKTYLQEGIVFIRSQNVHMNELRLEDVAHISEDVHKKMDRTWVKDGDVLLNITGASLGRVAVYRGQDNKANVNQHVCIIRVNKAKAIPEYVSYYLSMPNAQNEIWTIQAGASRQALNFRQVKSLKIYLPPIEEQMKFASFVSKNHDLKEKQNRSTQEISELFNSLMSKAFKGELVHETRLRNKHRVD